MNSSMSLVGSRITRILTNSLYMPKNFPGIGLDWIGCFLKALMIINSLRTQTWAFQRSHYCLGFGFFSSLDFTNCPSTCLIGTRFCQILNKYLANFANSIRIFKSSNEWNLELFACFQNFKHHLKVSKSSTWWTCASIGCEFVKGKLLFLASIKEHAST